MKKSITIAGLALCGALALSSTSGWSASDPEAVVNHYADMALAKFQDSLSTAETLNAKINEFLADPTEAGLVAARNAWLDSRIPYQQTEVYRFGNAIVDDWEGRVNAWPLDEGLIDYVDPRYGTESDENNLYTANVIANADIMIDGSQVSLSEITAELLQDTLHEAGGIEANVTTGYHAIEFLLWGQDLNGTGQGAGNRAYTDFSTTNCTNGNCDRRADYLRAASNLLVADLQEMVANWGPDGDARKALEASGASGGLTAMLTGMGSLSYGELAGERMKLGLLLHDPEEEHDCFSDNTHNSHFYDAMGIRNAYLGEYRRADGSTVTGPSLSALVSEKDKALDNELRAKLDATIAKMQELVDRADKGEAYDQMIGEGNAEGNAAVQAAIDALIDQTRSIERVIATLDLGAIELEGSDSLDSPNAVFQ